jgi:hypothetical protein
MNNDDGRTDVVVLVEVVVTAKGCNEKDWNVVLS